MGNTDFKQLVFFWIEKYRNLRNAGFNFGSEYVFSVESVDGTLVVEFPIFSAQKVKHFFC